MENDQSNTQNSPAFERISKVLSYIHSNLNAQLSLEGIAEQSCWSRWQLQRVFQSETGLTVANYVRDLKLSVAAERLLDSKERIIDISLDLGFNSEVSFSRSFKQVFGVSPGQYRKRAQRVGLKKPIEISGKTAITSRTSANFVSVRIDSRDSFIVKGLNTQINGLFSLSPDFSAKVPQLWQQLEQQAPVEHAGVSGAVGVIDVTKAEFDGSNIVYWAGVELNQEIDLPLLPSLISDKFELLTVPAQTYAVVTHKGPVQHLPATLQWFILNWLPNSGYRGIDGYELEAYPAGYQADSADAAMEYWIPITKVS